VRALVPTHIRGFDEELGGGVPQGHVVLLRGSTGTMKSSLAYSVLYRNAQKGVRGLYVTLEQDAASLLGQMAALGLNPTSVSDALPVLDLSRGRERLLEIAEKMKGLAQGKLAQPRTAILKAEISRLRKATGFELLAIDSWRALEFLLQFRDPRGETFALFEWLRGLGCTTFLIAELPDRDAGEGLEEEFLADAVFSLRLEPVTATSFQRRIQCSKMRAAHHSSDFFTLVFDAGRFEVAKAIS
jgi:KaiC/GvpD/RAD55 family RecA-like ATPase